MCNSITAIDQLREEICKVKEKSMQEITGLRLSSEFISRIKSEVFTFSELESLKGGNPTRLLGYPVFIGTEKDIELLH